MVTNLYRIIKYGVQGFFRNGWASVSALLVMMLALFVFLALIVFNVLTANALNTLRDKIDISVYFQPSVSENDIAKVKQSLESLKEVQSVKYISKNEALALFQERHKNDETINKAITVLESNPLSASLNIKANDPRDYPIIASYLNNDNFKNLIDQVNYNQNQTVLNRLANILETGSRIGLGLTVVLSLVAIFVTLNTIILAIYSTKDEISIMRLVGASNKFIRGPYMVQGALYGISAAILSLILMAPLIYVASPYFRILMPELSLQGYFYGNLLKLLGYQLIFGIALGSFSSLIAVRKYLKI